MLNLVINFKIIKKEIQNWFLLLKITNFILLYFLIKIIKYFII